MKLSIIIPCWNVEDYIEECLTSLLPQLTKQCELILVDDCSTDNTKAKASELIKGYNNAYIVKAAENGGVSNARNLGIGLSEGEYLAFIDSDDIVCDTYIEEILKAISSNKDVYLLSWIMFGKEEATYYAKSLPDWNCSVWSRIFKRSILEHYFDKELQVAEDHKFLKDNIKDTHSIGYIDTPIYKYRSGRVGSLCNVHYQI